MKSHTVLALLHFNLKLLPRFIWPMLAIFCLNASIMEILGIIFHKEPWIGEVSGIVTNLNSFPLTFCGLLAMQFFPGGTGWTGTPSVWLMLAGEFLLVRPVSRRMVYFSRIFLYFMIILSPLLLKVSLTMVEPDLRVSLHHDKTQSTEAADKLNLYQGQFPKSSLIHEPREGHDALVIPFGAVLVALWQLWLALLLALAVQTATLLTLPSKIQIGILMAICFAPLLMTTFRPFGNEPIMLENVFFFFVHYGGLIALFTLGAFVLVQRMAIKRIQNLEVI